MRQLFVGRSLLDFRRVRSLGGRQCTTAGWANVGAGPQVAKRRAIRDIAQPFNDQLAYHLHEAWMRTGRGGADHVDPQLFADRFGLGVQVKQYLEMV